MGARVLLPHPHIPGHPFKPPLPLLHSHTGAAPPPGGPTTSTEYIKHKSHRPPSHPVNGRNKEGRHASKQSHWSEREGRWSFCFPVSAVRTLGVAQEPLCSTNTHAPRLPRTIGKGGSEERTRGHGSRSLPVLVSVVIASCDGGGTHPRVELFYATTDWRSEGRKQRFVNGGRQPGSTPSITATPVGPGRRRALQEEAVLHSVLLSSALCHYATAAEDPEMQAGGMQNARGIDSEAVVPASARFRATSANIKFRHTRLPRGPRRQRAGTGRWGLQLAARSVCVSR